MLLTPQNDAVHRVYRWSQSLSCSKPHAICGERSATSALQEPASRGLRDHKSPQVRHPFCLLSPPNRCRFDETLRTCLLWAAARVWLRRLSRPLPSFIPPCKLKISNCWSPAKCRSANTRAASSPTCRALQPGRRQHARHGGGPLACRGGGCAGPALRHTGIQPLAARRAEKRHRPRLAPLRPQRLGRQARGRDRRVGGRHRHLHGPTAPAQHPGLPGRTHPGQPEAFLHATDTLFTATGEIGPASKVFLQGWMDHYVAWVQKFAHSKE